jgi:hypothetical protein
MNTSIGAYPIIRSGKKCRRSVDVNNPTVTVDDVSVKLPKSGSNFVLLSGFRIIGRAPIVVLGMPHKRNVFCSPFVDPPDAQGHSGGSAAG